MILEIYGGRAQQSSNDAIQDSGARPEYGLIKSGEVTPPPMLQSATDSETKQQHSGSLHSAFSPSRQLSSRTSPPIRQPLFTDSYSEPLRLLNLQSYNSLVKMESVPESTKRFSADGRPTSSGDRSEPKTVMVVVDASLKLTLAALRFALKENVRPGDRLYLLGVLHQVFNPMGYKQKADARGAKFGGINEIKLQNERMRKLEEFEDAISDQEVQELFALKQVTPTVVIGTGPDRKEVTKEWAEQLSATWVILDKNLKKDKGFLKENLNCNIVMMNPKGYEATLVRVYQDKGNTYDQYQDNMDLLSAEFDRVEINDTISLSVNAARDSSFSNQRPSETMMTQLMKDWDTPPPADYQDYSLPTDSDREPSSEVVTGTLEESPDRCPLPEIDERPAVLTSTEMPVDVADNAIQAAAGFYQKPSRAVSTGDLRSLPLIRTASGLYRPSARSANDRAGDELMNILNPPSTEAPIVKGVRTLKTSLREDDPSYEEPSPANVGGPIGRMNGDSRFSVDGSQSRKKLQPRVAPLCSVCQHPGPDFGKDAKEFSYAELEVATNNFDQDNYLAEGGYGFVYRGRLENGQEIAVKQYKAASSQGDDEFYSEVEVLKHAQHRNLVILIGFCMENEKRLLVYEFVCNKSLDVHLSAKNPNVLKWEARWKVAVGAARGLRYLHEECRVGCIVHRDMRPNNILLTHDFVPMVGDFGLARSQLVGDEAEETRVIGTLGYLAPEYAESGTLTEKADVYSFGVVLLELITGRKAIDATKPRGETCLTEWARPLIYANKTTEIVDTRLKGFYDENQVIKMVFAAGKCIQKDKTERPRMSEVLRILERDENTVDPISRAQSFTELVNEAPPNPPKRAISSGSLIDTKSNVAPVVTTPLSTHREDYNSQNAKQVKRGKAKDPLYTPNDQRVTTSPRKKISLRPSLSPSGKHSLASSPATKSKSKPKPTLSYDQML